MKSMRDLSEQHIRNAASFWSPFSSRHLDEFASQKWPPKGFTFQFVQVTGCTENWYAENSSLEFAKVGSEYKFFSFLTKI